MFFSSYADAEQSKTPERSINQDSIGFGQSQSLCMKCARSIELLSAGGIRLSQQLKSTRCRELIGMEGNLRGSVRKTDRSTQGKLLG